VNLERKKINTKERGKTTPCSDKGGCESGVMGSGGEKKIGEEGGPTNGKKKPKKGKWEGGVHRGRRTTIPNGLGWIGGGGESESRQEKTAKYFEENKEINGQKGG